MDAPSWLPLVWAWGVAVTLQATLLLALAWIADRLLARRAWPEMLALLWWLALVRFFLPPDLRSPWSVTAVLGGPALAAARVSPGAYIPAAACAIWLAGLLVCVVLRAARRARLHATVKHVLPSREWLQAFERAARTLGTRRRPRIGCLEGLATPAVLGILRPTLLLPRGWLERAPGLRDQHALLHELAHLERGDLWRDELCALLRAALWFHPLAWVAVARLHALRELQCDRAVARALGSEAHAYRDSLVLAARQWLTPPAPRGLRAFVGLRSSMVLRIERLGDVAPRSPGRARAASAGLALVFSACVVPMAPAAAELHAQARAVFAAQARGEPQSCFALQAAALVLAAESSPRTPEP